MNTRQPSGCGWMLVGLLFVLGVIAMLLRY
jgi:hypothetical protein